MRLPFGLKLTRRAPEPPRHVRRFDGATPPGGRRGWGFGNFGRHGTETALAGPTLRARARSLSVNNAWLANAVSNWTGALVGAGIVPTGDPESVAAWNEWSDDADADERTDAWGLQAGIARHLVVDGEAFAQIVATDAGPRVRVIPPELVDESLTRDLGNGRYIVNGVEFNATGERDAYHVLPSIPSDAFATAAAPVRVPAAEIMHIFTPLGAGQVRGVSWLAPVIVPASELDQLHDALLVGVKTAAMFAGFVVNQNAVGGEDPFDGEDSPSLEPGTLQRLAGGWDVKFTTPQQAGEVGAFLRHNLQLLAAGLGMPEHLLSGDLTNANYSSLRAGLLPFRQKVEQIQYFTLVPQLLNPLWRAVIHHAAAAGNLPGFEADPARFLQVEWLPPSFMQVDPLKQVQADVAELEAGLTSRRKLVAQRGWALADLEAELAAEGWEKGGRHDGK